MKHSIFFLWLFLLGGMLQAQTLTLDSCRALALEHNSALQKAVYSVESAREQQKEAFTKYFPALSAGGTYYKADKALVEMDLSALIGQPMGVAMLEDGLLGQVTATWPIFVGGRIIQGNRLAKVGYEVAQLQYLQTRKEVAITAEEYYWRIVLLQEKRETLLVLQQQLTSIGADVSHAVEAGLALENDLLQVQIRQNELASSLSTLQSSLQVCRMLLNQYCGISTDTLLTVVYDSLEQTRIDAPATLFLAPEAALAHTPEYGLLDKNYQTQLLQYRMEVGKYMPSVALMGAYVYNDLMGSSMNRMLVGVQVNVPLSGWWGGSHAIRQKKLAVKTAQLDQLDNQQKLIIYMTSAYSSFEDACRQTEIARRSIRQGEENLRIATELYRAGTSTMTDLLEAQSLYLQSRNRYTEAFTQYQLKRLAYLQATGR